MDGSIVMLRKLSPLHSHAKLFRLTRSLCLLQVIATDPDVGAAGTVKYSITTPNTPFQINVNTGVITAKQEIR